MSPHPTPHRRYAGIVRACARPLGQGVILALSLALGGCRQAGAPSTPSVPAATIPATPLDAVPGAGPAAGSPPGSQATRGTAGADSAMLAALPGRVIAIAAMASGDRNQVVAIEPATGATETLWTTPEGGNASDWSPAPDGRDVAYRLIQRSSPLEAVEAIVVRGLQAEAAPAIVAGLDTSTARLAGFVRAPDGRRIAYLRRTGSLPGAGESPSPTEGTGTPGAAGTWELHVVEWADQAAGASGPIVPDDRVIWESGITDASPADLKLVGWDPSAGRAALAEIAGDSGLASALRLIDTSTGAETRRLDLSLPPASIAPSPDGRWLALPESEATPPRLRLIELATGNLTDLATFADATTPGEAVWAPDSAWLAWSEYAPGGVLPTTRVMPVAGSPPGFSIALEDAGAQPLAFAPDAGALLVGAATEPGGLPEHLAVVRMPSGERSDLPWMVPADAWGVGWVP